MLASIVQTRHMYAHYLFYQLRIFCKWNCRLGLDFYSYKCILHRIGRYILLCYLYYVIRICIARMVLNYMVSLCNNIFRCHCRQNLFRTHAYIIVNNYITVLKSAIRLFSARFGKQRILEILHSLKYYLLYYIDGQANSIYIYIRDRQYLFR